MSVNVEALTNRVAATLRDANNDSWPESTIHDAIFEAEKVITNFRPDASVVSVSFACVAGCSQSLASLSSPAVNRLLKVKHNITNGYPGRSVQRVAEGDLDRIRPDWRSSTQASVIKEFIYDEREPLAFYVNPPAQAGTQIQIAFSAIPEPYGDVDANTVTTVSDLYEPMLYEWALYRLFGHDVEGSVNISRSQQHLMTFQNQMGIKIEAEKAFGPKNLEHEK